MEMTVLSFLKNKNSIKELLNTINYFSSFTGLKLNLSKCEVAWIGTLKGVEVAIKVLIIPNQIIDALQQIQKDFLGNSFSPKVTHENKDFEYGGLKHVDRKSKITSLQCSWVKKLYDESFHRWKIIPLNLIKNAF